MIYSHEKLQGEIKHMFDYKNELILRKPNKEEQLKARIDTSDFQISGLTIQSSILHALGFCSKIYRSKTTTLQHSTKRQAKRYSVLLSKLFALFDQKDDVSALYDALKETNGTLSEKYGVEMCNLLDCGKSWRDLCKMETLMPLCAAEVRARHAKPPKIKYRFDRDDVYEDETREREYEPTEEEVEECKKLYTRLNDFVHFKFLRKELPLKKYINKISVLDSFVSLISDPFFDQVRNEIMDFNGNIKALKRFLDKFIANGTKGTVRGHSQTILEEECIEKQEEVAKTLSDDGFPFDFEGFKYYLETYAPNVLATCYDKFGLDMDELDSFDDLREFFYAPDMMRKIRESLGVKVRARGRGQERVGNIWAVQSFNLDKKIKNLNDKLNGFNEREVNKRITQLKKKVSEREKENEQAKRARREAKSRYDTAKRRNDKDVKKYENEYEEMVQAAQTTSKLLNAARNSLKKAISSKDKHKSAIDKVKEYTKKYSNVLEAAKSSTTVGGTQMLENMEKTLKMNLLNAEDIPYSTWSFKVYDMDKDIIKLIECELEKAFSTIKGKNGEDSYINVTSYSYVDDEKNFVSEFSVDYPKNGKLYKAFENNRKLSDYMLDAINNLIKERFGRYLDFDRQHVVINVDMQKTLESGESPSDSWDIF